MPALKSDQRVDLVGTTKTLAVCLTFQADKRSKGWGIQWQLIRFPFMFLVAEDGNASVPLSIR